MVPRVGQRIGPYEILGRLGSGGMGLVFSAWDARLQRDVAIKLLRDEYATPDMRSRFLQEARAASGLNHPNICTIFDIGEQGGDPYLVMELLKGETLRARIASGTISPDDIVRVATEVADALTVAHTRGIIHRDIKPANIILVDKPGGRFGTKVLDFGLAKVDLGDGMDRFDLTTVGSTVGTVSYMSPEQARGEILDARSDLFSLGVVLYEMATGLVPFRGATSALVFVQLLSTQPEQVRELNAAIPKDLEKVIETLLQKDRMLRFQTAGELVEALHRIPIRGSQAGRSIWGAIPSLVRTRDATSVREDEIALNAAAKTAAEQVTRTTPVGEQLLRPVRRIATSDPNFEIASPAAAAQAGVSVETPPPSSTRPAADPGSDRTPTVAQTPIPESSVRPPMIVTLTPLPKSSSRLPRARFQRIEDLDEELAPPRVRTPLMASVPKKAYPWLLSAIVFVVTATTAWILWPRHVPTTISQQPTVILGSVNNLTGDDILSGALMAGLELDLQQSKHIAVRDSSALASGLRTLNLGGTAEPALADARQAAQAIGATHLIFGELRAGNGGGYTVVIRVYDTATGAEPVNVSETTASREQIPDAIDRLATEIRSGLGESSDEINKADLPLSKEATNNLDALHAYMTGSKMFSTGQYLLAMQAFERATIADQHFSQAYTRLADILTRQRAYNEAGVAAARARAAAVNASDHTRLLAEANYQLQTTGDSPRAAALFEQALVDYPNDGRTMVRLALALRAEGKYPESLEAAQKVLAHNPYDMDAAGAAEYAMLALDRTPAASQLEDQMAKAGGHHPGLGVLINYLGTRDNGQVGVDLSDSVYRVAPAEIEAEVLDAGGLLDAGAHMWHDLAAESASIVELQSAASEELSTAALDRALVGDCPASVGMLREAQAYPLAANATFNVGMSAAFCGDLQMAQYMLNALQAYPESFIVRNVYYPDLLSAMQWKSGDLDGALKNLPSAKQIDLISITPYLRGLIHLNANQPETAIVDFQGMLGHKGATTLTSPVLYPMAQFELGKAYGAHGDRGNSAAAYQQFLALWSASGSGQDMVQEARAAALQ